MRELDPREGALTELEVLIEQLDELLGEGAVDADDALEVAMVAGLASRLGASREVLAPAEAWRDGPGRALLDEAFDTLELEEVLGGIDAVLDGAASEEEVEEALYELDELVAAAVWCGRAADVRDAARDVARTIRQVPEPFAPLADLGVSMARLPSVGQDWDVYEYWMAVADAGGVQAAGDGA